METSADDPDLRSGKWNLKSELSDETENKSAIIQGKNWFLLLCDLRGKNPVFEIWCK